jgi:hypothetical protein
MDYLHSMLRESDSSLPNPARSVKSESSDDNDNFYICSNVNRKGMLLCLLVTAAC